MRSVLITLVLLHSISTYSQEKFQTIIQSIVGDSASGFSKYRGEKSENFYIEKSFSSTDQIPGTLENCVYELKDRRDAVYFAIFEDSVKYKKSIKISNAFKEKLLRVLGGSFHARQIPMSCFGPHYGWRIANSNFTIRIEVVGASSEGRYCVILFHMFNSGFY
jgi:hypothetical protein